MTIRNMANLSLLTPEALAMLAAAGGNLPETTKQVGKELEQDPAIEAATAELTLQVTTLTESNATLQADLEAKTAELAALTEKVTTAEATAETLKASALERCNVMATALSTAKPDATISAADLAALSVSLSATFNEKFKAGRVTTPSAKTEAAKTTPLHNAATLAAMRNIPITQ